MKVSAVVIGLALFVAVNAETFSFKCIRVDINGTITVTASKNGVEKKQVINFSDPHTITGNCSNANTTVSMTVTFDNVTQWMMVYNNVNNSVKLDETVRFEPATLFNDTAMTNDTVGVSSSFDLSLSNSSYECLAQENFQYKSVVKGGYTFTVTEKFSDLQAQAFGLVNNTFSPAEHCTQDQTTMAPTTEPTTAPATTAPVPTVGPVAAQTFLVKDAKGIVCFRLEAGLQFMVEYNTTNNTMVFSKPITIPSSANVTGTCATNTSNTATMIISGTDYALTITETRTKGAAVSAIQLNVTLDSANFPNAEKANTTVTFERDNTFALSSPDTFYVCQTEQMLHFNKTRTTLYTDHVRLQAFNLKNGSFSGDGQECSLDPTPKPITPSSNPGDNTYSVSSGNVTCIVFKGEISFSNVTYAVKGGVATADTLNIPAMNTSTHNVMANGSCDLEGGKAQQLVITFNGNWTLALTFALGSSKDSSMLTATSNEYSVRDVEFTYYQIPEFFPNATNQYVKVVASQNNITSDFMKGSTGGSYKCNAKQTETLDTGAQMETFNLQYKAFNTDNTTTFSDSVNECSADDQSNSIVPIAVGAALAGLVVIVLIAYLIGRRRSRRQGYESV